MSDDLDKADRTALAPSRALPERASIAVRPSRTGGYEVVVENAAIARIAPAGPATGFARAVGECSDARWLFGCRRERRSWHGVVEESGRDQPIAGYYPRRLVAGGELAFWGHSYRLQYRYVRGDWRLRADAGEILATLRGRSGWWDTTAIKELTAQVEPAFRLQPDFMPALLFTIWIILLEQETPRFTGGGGGP